MLWFSLFVFFFVGRWRDFIVWYFSILSLEWKWFATQFQSGQIEYWTDAIHKLIRKLKEKKREKICLMSQFSCDCVAWFDEWNSNTHCKELQWRTLQMEKWPMNDSNVRFKQTQWTSEKKRWNDYTIKRTMRDMRPLCCKII